MNALSLLQDELSLRSIPTSSRKLDEAMGNGIRFGTITEFAGRIGTGKTQLIFQLMFNTILPKPLGVIDGEAVYIATRPGSFNPERINEIADHLVDIWRNKYGNTPAVNEFTREQALSRILYTEVDSLLELIKTVYYLKKLVQGCKNNVSFNIPE